MDTERAATRGLDRSAENVLLASAALAPWAFGAVEAWAELLLELAIALSACLVAISGWRDGRASRPGGLPGLGLAGLAGLALAQTIPCPDGLLPALAPRAALQLRGLVPATPIRLLGSDQPAVPPPLATMSLDREETLHAAARLFSFWVLFQVVLNLRGGFGFLRRFGAVVAANATLLALFFLIQALTWNGKIYGTRPSPMESGWDTGGPFVGHGPLAAYLNIGLGFALAFLPTPSRRRRFNPWAAYAAGVIALGIVASHSRTGLLSLIVTSAVMMALLRRNVLRRAAGLIVSLTIVALFLAVLGVSSPLRRLGSIAESSEYSSRLEVWTAASRTWLDHPIWGTGLGTFATATAPYLMHDHGRVFLRAENEYLDVLVEGGAIGLALALLALTAMVVSVRRVLIAATSERRRFLVLGAVFGLLSLTIHSLGDFSSHIPAVGFTAVILLAHLRGLGLEAGGRPEERAGPLRFHFKRRWALLGGATLAVLFFTMSLTIERARAEAALAASDLPLPGTSMPTASDGSMPRNILERRRQALERALTYRPHWAEGHLRLGLAHLQLYQRAAEDWIGDDPELPETAAVLASPLRLHSTFHASSRHRSETAEGLLEHDPIRLHLLPAARCFLEARRLSPTLALPHAELASLDYLVRDGEATSVHVERAFQLAGADGAILALIARTAFQADGPELAARCWRKSLLVRPDAWREVADDATRALGSEALLNQVAPPDGKLLVMLAGRLTGDPSQKEVRARFLQRALDVLSRDRALPRAERRELEARAWAGLEAKEQARRCWREALALEPEDGEWRAEFAAWLIDQGDLKESRRQIQIGLQLLPRNPSSRLALEWVAEALAHR